MTPADPGPARYRWSVYALLIAVAVGQTSGRLLAVNSVDRLALEKERIESRIADLRSDPSLVGQTPEAIEQRVESERERLREKLRLQRPFLSANDRSRWLAVRALVEHGRWEIDGLVDEPGWDTIDRVRHRGRDGELHFYSSKPPLMIAFVAAECWALEQVTPWRLTTHPHAIVRTLLVVNNVLPLALMLVLVAASLERLVASPWANLLAVAVGCFGTFLTTFAVVLNNHLPAAVFASVVLYAWVRVRTEQKAPGWLFAAAGLSAALCAANELPALAFLALALVAFWLLDVRRTIEVFAPAAALVVVAFFAVNYWAHDTWIPPYAHRSTTDPSDNWYLWSYERDGKLVESYWNNRQGIDRGEQSRAVYALHCLVGHHGVFSLTPAWILAAFGGLAWLRSSRSEHRELAFGVLALSAVCLTFYIGLRPLEDRNYGGMTSGFRWVFWLTPLWLVLVAAAVEKMGRNGLLRAVSISLVALSCLSASYPTWNPWTQPWIVEWMRFCGWPLFQ